ncbi:hypothetical protein A2851_05805 [Candidatus Kaiserbacteria bacterium RIFCSPHIGHO2_01_FULL_53_29]|uniref:ZIP family metal transporter n=1 Tax=Candidatus Kaiserbacteria bacterium RIFCSPHIGHO2_01_FULL_53_29 TaxID=1798480 RepID=A0A1F6CY56_9BACT|nr:MAG: hypothetical protein A2851_05805 [Candidatus Kaiserbacteria bacterium RIFCSPHIGHO2_01_FULL_53_29]
MFFFHSMSPILAIFISILLVSFVSFSGVFLLSLHKTLLKKFLLYFVSFAVGALFANVFFHILPEAVEEASDVQRIFGLVLLGIILSLVLEKFIHWHHCHNLDCRDHHPVGTMVLIGDGAHNITDGILIATTYLVDMELGIATTIAIILHEIPQEIGDFAVLIHSGFSRSRALIWNFFSALTAFFGAIAVLVLREYISGIEYIFLPIIAGNFLYIAGSDLIPELHKESTFTQAFMQLCSIFLGIALIYAMTILEEPDHAMQQEHSDVVAHREQSTLLFS